MALNRETLHLLDPSRLQPLAGGLDTNRQCMPQTDGSCNIISCASGCIHCGYTYDAS